MKWSETTNDTGIVQDIDFLVGTNATSYPLKDKARNANRWYHRVWDWILESQDEWDVDDTNNTDFPIATTDLKANQQDYALPLAEGLLKVKRVEINYNNSDWYKAEPFDINERGEGTSTTQINNDYDPTKPFYGLFANSLFTYPIPEEDITAGLKIWFARKIESVFTATGNDTREPGFDEQFHRILSLGPAYDWALTKTDANRIQVLNQELGKYELELRRFYGKKQDDRRTVLKSAYIDYR
jgi:hypothetical protein